jgi:hypothetical protein
VNAGLLFSDLDDVRASRIVGLRCAAAASHGFIRAPFANVEPTAICALTVSQPVPIGGI